MNDNSDHGYLKLMAGNAEFKRVTGTLEDNVFAIMAMNGDDVVFGENCEVHQGDKPEAGDTIVATTFVFGTFKKVHITSGVAYCYLNK